MAPKGSIASMVKPVAVAKPKGNYPHSNLGKFLHPAKSGGMKGKC